MYLNVIFAELLVASFFTVWHVCIDQNGLDMGPGFCVRFLNMSLIMIRKIVDDSTLPCGKPWSCCVVSESADPHRTSKVLFIRKFL